MKKINLLILVLFSITVYSQNLNDLLKKVSKETNRDTLFILYDDISRAYTNLDIDKAIEFQKKSLEISKSINKGANLAYSYSSMGNLYMYKGNLNEAILNLTEGLKILENSNELSKAGLTYGNIGNVYLKLKMYDKALEFYNKGLDVKKKLGEKMITPNLFSISNVYRTQGKFKEAVEYLNEAFSSIDYSNPKSTKYISSIYSSLGVCYRGLDDYDKSLVYYNKVDSILSPKDLDQRATLYNNMAALYEYKNEERKALYYQYKSYNISKKLKDLESVSICYKNFVVMYSKLNMNDSSRYFFNEYEILSDSIKKIQSNEFTQELTTKYETQKKENEIVLLAKDKMLQSLLIKNQEEDLVKKAIESRQNESEILLLNKDKALKETELLSEKLQKNNKEKENQLLQTRNQLSNETIKQQKTFSYFTIVGLLLALGLAFFIFTGFKKQRKANAIISKQKEEVQKQKTIVEEKHKEITDSINYAERIQRSFLASTELLNHNLKEHFVFFQPKDVVSGDFYWAGKLTNGNFALVTADSTGHGVPGAIMSILNISSLEKAIEQGFSEPSEILNHTRKTIIERLKKDGSVDGGKDGMDCSLICFDFSNYKFSYAAANNPIWVVRGNEIIELTPDKMPVGKNDKDQISFTNHDFHLQKNDIVYTLTDGMPDQFGGPKGKKFMYKQLKELLISISNLPMKIQEEKLSEMLNSWRGDLEQVDDICVIGIKV
jgi:serine phosphatase RsbU (regulator of sigma subunit)